MRSMDVFNSRPKRLLALGAAAAMLLTGTAVALAQSQASAADQATAAAVAVTDPVSGAGLGTVATDKVDGDKEVKPGGVIVDKVTYTGLNVGTVYVLQSQLFDKTTGKLVDWLGLKIFSPAARDGVETVEIPVPAGSEGHEFVVYQTIWAGSDALVGKHLDKIQIRPGATPVVKEDNPNNPEQTVSVPNPQASVCTVSGYVWKDLDISGAMEASEPKVGGVKVTLRRLNAEMNNFPGTLVNVAEVTTDAQGFYKFSLPGEQCGTFMVDFDEKTYPAGWNGFHGGSSWLKPENVDNGWTRGFTLVPGQNREHVDAGLRNNAGIRGEFCAGGNFDGYTVDLKTAGSNQLVQSQPLSGGTFTFKNVPSGRYWLYFYDKDRSNTQPVFAIMEGGDIWWTYFKDNFWGTIYDAEAGTYEFDYSAGTAKVIRGCGVKGSPIALDLNGNGQIDTSNIADQPAGAKFDLLGTGKAVKSGWVAQGDGLLVAPNADGSVTSINNLFGGALGEGYAKLAKRDANNDGVLTGAELNGLKAWVDANGDHQAQAGELQSLSAYGITSLNTKFVNKPVSNNGNAVIEHSNATNAFGKQIVTGDAYFEVDTQRNAANDAALAKVAAKNNAKLATLPAAEARAIRNAFAGL